MVLFGSADGEWKRRSLLPTIYTTSHERCYLHSGPTWQSFWTWQWVNCKGRADFAPGWSSHRPKNIQKSGFKRQEKRASSVEKNSSSSSQKAQSFRETSSTEGANLTQRTHTRDLLTYFCRVKIVGGSYQPRDAEAEQMNKCCYRRYSESSVTLLILPNQDKRHTHGRQKKRRS